MSKYNVDVLRKREFPLKVADTYIGLSAQAGPLETEIEKGIKALTKYQKAAEATANNLKSQLGGNQNMPDIVPKSSLGSISMLSGGMAGVAGLTAGAAIAAADFAKNLASAAASGAYGLGKWAISLASDAEKAQTAFGVMLHSETAARDMLIDLKQYANVSPFSNVQVRESAQLLLNYGIKAKDLLPTMKQIGDIAAGDAQKMEGLSRAFGQMSSAGRLMGQDLNQMINAGFNPLKVISEKTGESMFALKARMEAGKIGIQEVKDAMTSATSAGGQFYQMTEKQSKTLGGLWSSAVDVVENALTALGETLVDTFDIKGLIGGFNDTFSAIPDAIKALSPIVKMFVTSFQDEFAFVKESALIAWNALSGGKSVMSTLATAFAQSTSAIRNSMALLKTSISDTLTAMAFLANATGRKLEATALQISAAVLKASAMADIAKSVEAANSASGFDNNVKKQIEAEKEAAAERAKILGSAREDAPKVNPGDDEAAKLFGKLTGELRELQMQSKIATDLYDLQQKGASQEALKAIQSIQDEIEATKKLKKERDDMIKEAEKVLEDIKTPAEKAAEEFEKLKKLLEAGFLDEDQFGKAIEKLEEKDKKKDKSKDKANSAVLAGSEKFREMALLQMNPSMQKDDLQKKANVYLEQIAKQTKENTMAGEPNISFAFVS